MSQLMRLCNGRLCPTGPSYCIFIQATSIIASWDSCLIGFVGWVCPLQWELKASIQNMSVLSCPSSSILGPILATSSLRCRVLADKSGMQTTIIAVLVVATVDWQCTPHQTRVAFPTGQKGLGFPLKAAYLKRFRPESMCNWDTKEQDTKPAPKNQKIWDLLGSEAKIGYCIHR